MLISSIIFNRSKKHVHSSGEQNTIYIGSEYPFSRLKA